MGAFSSNNKSLSSHTEEDKGKHPILNQFLILTVAASVMPPVAMALAFVEGGDFICLRQYASRLGSLFNKQFFASFAGCRNIMCSRK